MTHLACLLACLLDPPPRNRVSEGWSNRVLKNGATDQRPAHMPGNWLWLDTVSVAAEQHHETQESPHFPQIHLHQHLADIEEREGLTNWRIYTSAIHVGIALMRYCWHPQNYSHTDTPTQQIQSKRWITNAHTHPRDSFRLRGELPTDERTRPMNAKDSLTDWLTVPIQRRIIALNR